MPVTALQYFEGTSLSMLVTKKISLKIRHPYLKMSPFYMTSKLTNYLKLSAKLMESGGVSFEIRSLWHQKVQSVLSETEIRRQ